MLWRPDWSINHFHPAEWPEVSVFETEEQNAVAKEADEEEGKWRGGREVDSSPLHYVSYEAVRGPC